jgi:glycosyltransferase involved in cell wall biosynthesis
VQKLSVIIPCYNEERNIGDCIKTVQWADEILAVDSFSTDSTVDIARSLGATVLQHEYVNSAAQKNWAIPQAENDWVLIVDADERVSDGLREEVQQVLRADGPCDGYWIRRENYFFGRRIRFSGWRNDGVVRLFRRDRGRYEEKHVHASLLVDGRVGKCRHPFLHYSYRTIEDELVKIRRYGAWGAEDARAAKKKAGVRRLLLHPAFRFFYDYVVRGGFLDGKHGLVLCMFNAFGAFYKYARLWEMELAEGSERR